MKMMTGNERLITAKLKKIALEEDRSSNQRKDEAGDGDLTALIPYYSTSSSEEERVCYDREKNILYFLICILHRIHLFILLSIPVYLTYYRFNPYKL